MKAWISLRSCLIACLLIVSNVAIFAQISGDVSLTGRVSEGPSRIIETKGALLFHGDGSDFVIRHSVSNEEIGRIRLKAAPQDIVLKDNFAYLACGKDGFAVIDLANLNSPELSASFQAEHPIDHIAIMGEHAYLSTGQDGIIILSLVEPNEVFAVGRIPAVDFTGDVIAENGMLFFSDGFGRIRIIDASLPDTPSELSSDYFNTRPSLLALQDHMLYAVDRFNVSVIDVANPQAPSMQIRTLHGADALALAQDEHTLYVSGEDAELHVIDVSDPISPTTKEVVTLQDDAAALHANGKFLFTALMNKDIQSFDTQLPAISDEYQLFKTGGFASDLKIFDNKLVLTGARTRMFDISYPADPKEIGKNEVASRVNAISESGNHLFVADDRDSLRVYDINSPNDPAYVGHYDGPGQVIKATVNNHILFLARPYVIRLIDVHNPVTPLEVSTYFTGVPFALTAIGVHEQKMFLGFSNGDIRVVDISSPTQPQDRGRYRDFGSEPVAFAFANDFVYAAFLERGLTIFREGFGPIPWANIPSQDKTRGVAVNGDLVYIADGDAGLRIMEVKSPEQIRQVAGFTTGNSTSRVAVSGDRAFLADDLSGIYLLQTDFSLSAQVNLTKSAATTLELQQNYPNPFNPETTIRFRLAGQHQLTATIYNILGQTVRQLANGTFDAGDYQIRWNGRDEIGAQVGSGVYFLRIQSGTQVYTQRLMLLK
ncbi:MAG: T9SS type A sorting domain-containing protein [Calditrichia bacterium]